MLSRSTKSAAINICALAVFENFQTAGAVGRRVDGSQWARGLENIQMFLKVEPEFQEARNPISEVSTNISIFLIHLQNIPRLLGYSVYSSRRMRLYLPWILPQIDGFFCSLHDGMNSEALGFIAPIHIIDINYINKPLSMCSYMWMSELSSSLIRTSWSGFGRNPDCALAKLNRSTLCW